MEAGEATLFHAAKVLTLPEYAKIRQLLSLLCIWGWAD